VKQVGDWIVYDDRKNLIPEDEFNPEDVRRKLTRLVAPEGKIPVISHERLAGHPLSGGFDRSILAKRIKMIFPRAKVLVTIRSQNEVILSNYMQYLRYGGWHTPEELFRPRGDGRVPTPHLSFWDYYRLYEHYSHIFGVQNVLFLPQELLRRSPTEFLRPLADFIGSRVVVSDSSMTKEINARKPIVSSYVLRQLTAFGRRSSANSFVPSLVPEALGRIIDGSFKRLLDLITPPFLERDVASMLKRKIDHVVGNYYSESNLKFKNVQLFDLADFGYHMETADNCQGTPRFTS
jgi:hypothetical protein